MGDVSQPCAKDLEPGGGGGIERWNLGSHPHLPLETLFHLPSPEYKEESKVNTAICRLVAKAIVYWAVVVSEDKDLHCSFPFIGIITNPIAWWEETNSNEIITEINLVIPWKLA